MTGALCAVPGGKVWYEVLNPEATGTPLVVVHGGPGTPHDYLRPLADLLPGHPVLVYDQLGCGRSEHPADPRLWRLPRFVDELGSVLDEVGWTRFHLLGHSSGSMIACDFVLGGTRRPESLVLYSPVLSVRRHERAMQDLLLRLPPATARAIAAGLRGGMARSPEFGRAMVDFAERHLCRLDPWPEVLVDTSLETSTDVRDTMWGATEFQVTGNLSAYSRVERLAELGTRTLLVCGEHDFTSPQVCRGYLRALPDGDLGVISGASHLAHLEQPERFGTQLAAFLGGGLP